MQHTYLFEEGLWAANGIYINEPGDQVDVQGNSIITHHDDNWVIELTMKLVPTDQSEYRNLDFKTVYEVQPIIAATDAMEWVTHNASMGRLNGLMTVVHDSILSTYQSTNGNIRGTETLIKVSDSQYQCRGALFEGARRGASWFLSFTRE